MNASVFIIFFRPPPRSPARSIQCQINNRYSSVRIDDSSFIPLFLPRPPTCSSPSPICSASNRFWHVPIDFVATMGSARIEFIEFEIIHSLPEYAGFHSLASYSNIQNVNIIFRMFVVQILESGQIYLLSHLFSIHSPHHHRPILLLLTLSSHSDRYQSRANGVSTSFHLWQTPSQANECGGKKQRKE